MKIKTYSKTNLRQYLNLCTILLFFTFSTNAQLPTFWGMTNYGGSANGGVIFKTDENGRNQTVVFSSLGGDISGDGYSPRYTRLIEVSDGYLYGMIKAGGANRHGVIFKHNPINDIYTKLYDFDGVNGSSPTGSLMEASNGKLYGMTRKGGAFDRGVLFEFDPQSNIYTKLLDFDETNGKYPQGSSLLEAFYGKLYGMTAGGGINDHGVLFEYDIQPKTFKVLLNFDGINGGAPYGSLIQASNGKLYGMTKSGGTNNEGVIFVFDVQSNNYYKLYDFDNANGSGPRGSLIEASNGKLYAMTLYGGSKNKGVIFEFDIHSESYTMLVSFDETNGAAPYGSLVETSDGKLYGMTQSGGTYNMGVIFEYDLQLNQYSKLLDFDEIIGVSPYGSLIQASNGKLYGMTQGGGENKVGVIFNYNIQTHNYTKLKDFDGLYGGYPSGSLLQASNGKLYGMTRGGGKYFLGVIFEYSIQTNKYITLHDFNRQTGAEPLGTLIQASNGKLYGMTSEGGTYDKGTILEYDLQSKTYNTLFNFDETSGESPYSSLIEASNGKLYGMTFKGGKYYSGVIFEYNIQTNTYSILYDFDCENGCTPFGSLMEVLNGKLVGLTSWGGINNAGVIFEYDLQTNTYTKLYDFDDSVGSYPYGTLMQASNGTLYGMTRLGGTNNAGVIFEFDFQTNNYSKLIDFNRTNGENPYSSTLLEASNGKLYGMTWGGGTDDKGVIFEYDLQTNTYSITTNFNGTNGDSPYGSLIEVNDVSTVEEINILDNVRLYPNPTDGIFFFTNKGELEEGINVEVLDVTGRKVIKKKAKTTGDISIDLSNYPKGPYLVRLMYKGHQRTIKIIVK